MALTVNGEAPVGDEAPRFARLAGQPHAQHRIGEPEPSCAELDGASGFQQFLRVTVPLVTPSIFFQTLIAAINAFQAYDYIYMLTRRSGGDSSVRRVSPRAKATPPMPWKKALRPKS